MRSSVQLLRKQVQGVMSSEEEEQEGYSIDLNEFDLEGFTQEEIRAYNAMAEPGQRLESSVRRKRSTTSRGSISGRLRLSHMHIRHVLIAI